VAKNIITFSLCALLCISLVITKPNKSYAESKDALTAEKLVAAHVKSLGNPALLAKVQSRMFLGNTEVKILQGANWNLKGNSMFVSQGPKLGIVLKYQDINYPGEYFAYDGKNVTVGTISPGQKSPIADFLYRFNKIVKGGFLGGALTTSWPLYDGTNKDADMKCRKVKKENRELYELEYHPRKGFGDIKIRMYFDPTTFRHVRTEYTVQNRNDSSHNNNYMGAPTSLVGEIGQSRLESYYTLVEKFEDYKKVSGMMLPYRYILEYSQEGGAGAFVGRWTLNVGKWLFNVPNLEPKIFQAEK
jgi:hypothetical protein